MDWLIIGYYRFIFCDKPVNGWHVKCCYELRKVENACEALPYLENYIKKLLQNHHQHYTVQ